MTPSLYPAFERGAPRVLEGLALARPLQFTLVMMTKLDVENVTCWCGRDLSCGEKRCLFGLVWCVDCFSRLLRSCPRALFQAAWDRVPPDVEDEA